jgi:hypothetical protein
LKTNQLEFSQQKTQDGETIIEFGAQTNKEIDIEA